MQLSDGTNLLLYLAAVAAELWAPLHLNNIAAVIYANGHLATLCVESLSSQSPSVLRLPAW